jgi:hypothetical protein
MIASQSALNNLLLSNVLDIRFTRRIPVGGKAPTRRMLCTKSYDLLNTINGKVVLNYQPPRHAKQIDEAITNTCIVWDILMQDYRVVSADQVDVLREIPANDSFWKIFNEEIYPMTPEQKLNFMNS